MALPFETVRNAVNVEEPDYPYLAEHLGEDALPALLELVRTAGGLLASKATYLASVIGGEGGTEVVSVAAAHPNPIVRVSAAAGAENLPHSQIKGVLRPLLRDLDPGVQKATLKTIDSLDLSEFLDSVRDLNVRTENASVRSLSDDVAKRLDKR